MNLAAILPISLTLHWQAAMVSNMKWRRHKEWEAVGLKSMTLDQRRAYNNARRREWRLRQKAGILTAEKPETYNCRTCKEEKPFNDRYFPKNKSAHYGLSRQCRICRNIKHNAKQYGISTDEYIRATSGNCAICDTPAKLVMDHCHRSGLARDGLCNSCNSGLGLFRDDPTLMRRAIEYVAKHELLS